MRKKNTRKNNKTATKCRKLVPVLPYDEINAETPSVVGPVVQLEVPLLPVAPPAAEDPILKDAVAKVEQEIEKICDSDRYRFEFNKESLDAQIREARKHLNRLRAIRQELYPGFIRRVIWYVCRR